MNECTQELFCCVIISLGEGDIQLCTNLMPVLSLISNDINSFQGITPNTQPNDSASNAAFNVKCHLYYCLFVSLPDSQESERGPATAMASISTRPP